MPGRDRADVVAAQRARSPGRRRPHRLGGRHAHLAHGEGDHERHRAREARPGVAVARERHRDAGVEQPARVGVRLAGRELDAGQQRRDGVAAGQGGDVVVVEVGAVIDGCRAQRDREPHALAGAELVAVHPRQQAVRDAGRRGSRRVSSGVKAPRSQNTSIQRACGAQAVSISPQTRSTYSSRRSANSAGTTCAPRKVTSGVTSAARRASRSSSCDGEAVPGLDLERRRALARAARRRSRRGGARSSSSVAARVAATVRRMPPAAYGVPAMRASNSSARSPPKTRCVWLSTKPGMTARPPGIDDRDRPAPGSPRRSLDLTAMRLALDRARAASWRAPRRIAVRRDVGRQLARCVGDQRSDRRHSVIVRGRRGRCVPSAPMPRRRASPMAAIGGRAHSIGTFRPRSRATSFARS